MSTVESIPFGWLATLKLSILFLSPRQTGN